MSLQNMLEREIMIIEADPYPTDEEKDNEIRAILREYKKIMEEEDNY